MREAKQLYHLWEMGDRAKVCKRLGIKPANRHLFRHLMVYMLDKELEHQRLKFMGDPAHIGI